MSATPNGSRVVVRQADGNEVDVTEGVMAMYDMVIGSLDWGSGFFTVEDALPLVHVAKACQFAECEEAERYVESHRDQAERTEILRALRQRLPAGMVSARHGRAHEHVYTRLGTFCVWPGCSERRAAP